MPALGIVRFRRSQVVKALVLAFVFLSFLNQKVFAASDWTAIQTVMGASGVEMPGDVLRFDLVRSDLNMSVNGQPQTLGAVANGFVSFKPAGNGQMFVDGSLPAKETELATLETAFACRQADPYLRHRRPFHSRIAQPGLGGVSGPGRRFQPGHIRGHGSGGYQ